MPGKKKNRSFFFTSGVLLSVLKLWSRLYTKLVSSEWLCIGEQKLQNENMTIKKWVQCTAHIKLYIRQKMANVDGLFLKW